MISTLFFVHLLNLDVSYMNIYFFYEYVHLYFIIF